MKRFSCVSKRLYYRLSVFLVLLFLGGGCWFWWTSSRLLCIPIKIDDHWAAPLVWMDVGKRSYQVQLDLSAESSGLNRKELREIDKHYCGSYTTFDALGNVYERSIYEVLGVNIHGLKVSKMRIHEETPPVIVFGDPEKVPYSGHIGRDVLEGRNFLLDFASSKMILCRNFKDLARERYDLSRFVEVPFEMNKTGICFKGETDLGEKTLLLNPASCRSFFRSLTEKEDLHLEPFHHLQLWHNQKFNLNGYEFGPRDFILFEISSLVEGIDGVLGMDFLKEYAVFIDREKSVAYIGKSPQCVVLH